MLGSIKEEQGPFDVDWCCYRSGDELLELLGLLRDLADQLVSISIREPAEIQLQDLIRHPIRQRTMARAAGARAIHESIAPWQLRMLDVGACVAARRWSGPPVEFDLVLTDPLAGVSDARWGGVGGQYSVVVGEQSCAAAGNRGDLPVLQASVNAFSRMWWSVRPASGLAISDDLGGPPELLSQLDEALRLAPPHQDWSF